MGFFGIILVGLVAGGAAFGATVTANLFDLPDLSQSALERQVKAVEKRQMPVRDETGEPTPQPAIDVLRAEPDGSFVVAGRAAPNSTVELVDRDGSVVAKGAVDRTGDFVLLPEANLTPGAHELRLQTGTGEARKTSQEAAIVSIPEQKSEPVLAAVVPQDAPAVAVNTLPPAPAPVADTPKADTPAVAIEAVEVDGGQLAIAGAVKQGATVQVYLDNKPIGRAVGTSNGRFVLETERKLEPGRHNMRADVIDRTDGSVVARAAVPVLHKSEAQMEEADALKTGSSVIIRGGDSLWRISRRTYGQGIRYTTIFAANRNQIRDPNRIYIGQIFKLPADSTTGAPAPQLESKN